MKIRLRKSCDYCVKRKIRCVKPLNQDQCNQCVQRGLEVCQFSPAGTSITNDKVKAKEFQLKTRKRKACDSCIKAKIRCSGPDTPGGICSSCARKKLTCFFSMTNRKCKVPKQGEQQDLRGEVVKSEILTSDLDSECDDPPKSAEKKAPSLFLLATASQEHETLAVQDVRKHEHPPAASPPAGTLSSSPSPALQPFFSPSSAVGLVGHRASQYLSSFLTNTENMWPTSNRSSYTSAFSSFLSLGAPPYLFMTHPLSRERAASEHFSLLSAIAMGAVLQGNRCDEVVTLCLDQSRKLLPPDNSLSCPTPERARALMHIALLCNMLGDKENYENYLPAVENITSVLNGPADVQTMLKFCNQARVIHSSMPPTDFIKRNMLGEEMYTPEELSKFSLPVQFYLFAEKQLLQGRLLFKYEPEKLANVVLSSYETVCFAEQALSNRQPGPGLELYMIKLGKFFMEFVGGSHVAALASAYLIIQYLEKFPGIQFCPMKMGHFIHQVAHIFRKVGDEHAYNRLKAVLWDELPEYGALEPYTICDSFYCRQYGAQIQRLKFNTDPNAGVVGGRPIFQKDFLKPYHDGEKFNDQTAFPADPCTKKKEEEETCTKLPPPIVMASPSSVNAINEMNWATTTENGQQNPTAAAVKTEAT